MRRYTRDQVLTLKTAFELLDHNEEVETGPGAILRRINPGNAPNVDQPPIDLEATWQTAVTSIVEEHNQRAASSGDPVPVEPIQRWALELLRNPAALLPEGAEGAYQALSVDRSRTVRTALGAIRRDLTNEHVTPTTAANRIVEVVQSYGLREVEPAEPLTQITENDVGLVAHRCSYGCQVGDGAGWWVWSQVWYRVASWWLWSRPRSSAEMRLGWVPRAWAVSVAVMLAC